MYCAYRFHSESLAILRFTGTGAVRNTTKQPRNRAFLLRVLHLFLQTYHRYAGTLPAGGGASGGGERYRVRTNWEQRIKSLIYFDHSALRSTSPSYMPTTELHHGDGIPLQRRMSRKFIAETPAAAKATEQECGAIVRTSHFAHVHRERSRKNSVW